METNSKEEKGGLPEDKPLNSLVFDNSSLVDSYLHNLAECIDIHGDDQKQKVCCADMKDLHLEPKLVANTVKIDLHEPVLNTNIDFVNSLSASHNLKPPIKVSNEEDRKRESDTNLKDDDDNSDDEYQSADDGDEHENEEDESDSDFIPIGEYGDHITNDEAYVSEQFESDDIEEQEKEANVIDDMEVRKNLEAELTEEERQERKEKSQKLKDDGNAKFRDNHYDEAIIAYSEALELCPLNFHKERSIMFANRAACKMKKELFEAAIQDSTSALDLHPHYLKALLRRAELYERTDKIDEALKDYQKVVELDPSQGMARAACVKLAEQIKDRNEKMKEEMIGKLKDLGNLVLRPFGLSVNNFNLQKDPKSGSYSVQFQQNPPNNGS